jgi:hypothetical protein
MMKIIHGDSVRYGKTIEATLMVIWGLEGIIFGQYWTG